MSLFNLFSFRWRWGRGSLLIRPSAKEGLCLINEDVTRYGLKNIIPNGWYMIEIKIKSNLVRSDIFVSISNCVNSDDLESFKFPLYTERLCKRLIYVDCKSKLFVSFPFAQSQFQLIDFRLVRVTRRFAYSRLLRKLRALHPRYRAKRNTPIIRHPKFFLTKKEALLPLWEDYCSIFDGGSESDTYHNWINEFDTVSEEMRISMRSCCQKYKVQPLISVILPVYNPNPLWLKLAIESVRSQLYQNWELCIADDASSDPAVYSLINRFVAEDTRISVTFRKENGHISAASNSALDLARGEWVALLDHDDVLAEHALFWVVDAINRHPTCRLIYSDEDKIDEMGVRSDPYFKCDWNKDLFYSQNMFSHLGVYHTDLVREVGRFRKGMEGSQDYDLALRCIERISPSEIQHIARVLYHWRIHAESTAHSSDVKPYAMIAGERAISEHFDRCGIKAKVESLGHGYRVRYALPQCLPLVSLIIPTRNGYKLLQQCVESIFGKTSYEHYEIIIIDNGSDDLATLRYLEKLASLPNIRVIRDDRPFNYSALNNSAVKLARGEIVGLINNDIEVISPDWLSEMVSHAVRPEVGVVGAKLLYSDDTVQHAGVVLGIDGIAGHVHRFLPRNNVGYCGRANLIQSFSAVTGACLLVRKSIYEALGGLNEIELQVACNDVDFCLRAGEAGYRNIWTPYAELYHHESATRGFDDTPEKLERSAKEIAYMQQRWGFLLKHDPVYSPNLSLESDDFRLAWPPRISPVGDIFAIN